MVKKGHVSGRREDGSLGLGSLHPGGGELCGPDGHEEGLQDCPPGTVILTIVIFLAALSTEQL